MKNNEEKGIRISVSVGEIFDKITILQIKQNKVKVHWRRHIYTYNTFSAQYHRQESIHVCDKNKIQTEVKITL